MPSPGCLGTPPSVQVVGHDGHVLRSASERQSGVRVVGSSRRRLRDPGQRQVGYYKQVQDVIALDEHDLATLRIIECVADPVPRWLRNLARRNDECVIYKNPLAGLRVEYLVR